MRVHIVKASRSEPIPFGTKKMIRGIEHIKIFRRDCWNRLLVNSKGGFLSKWVPAEGISNALGFSINPE